ncbi:hypothetical protein ACA910_016297 [Epithemia clementina (nom. ined.)]
MLRGLQYMHDKRVAHRDLKPENLLLVEAASVPDPDYPNDDDGEEDVLTVKLAEFGFAKKCPHENGLRTLCGTPGYLAPEILERWPAYDVKCDLWSVGVILFLLLGVILFLLLSGDKAARRPNRKFEEDSKSGRPFDAIYELGDVLGEGGYACVYRAKHKRSGETYAVKDVNTGVLESSNQAALQNEIAAMKMLRGGPHIIRLFDVFEEPDHTFMILEEMRGGDLLTRISDKEVYTEREARKTCRILFEAMDYIHKKKIAHRDIKPANVLMVEQEDDTSIKIADFGSSKCVPRPNCLRTLCGTTLYPAPEVLDLHSSGYDQRSDMWSVGVVVYFMLGGYAPFEGPVQELVRAVCRADYCFHDKYWSDISDAAKDMIRNLLQIDPEVRYSAEDALQCPWMSIEDTELMVTD